MNPHICWALMSDNASQTIRLEFRDEYFANNAVSVQFILLLGLVSLENDIVRIYPKSLFTL